MCKLCLFIIINAGISLLEEQIRTNSFKDQVWSNWNINFAFSSASLCCESPILFEFDPSGSDCSLVFN